MSYAVKIAAALAVLAVLVLLVLFQLRRLRAQREEERLDQEEERRYQAQRRRYDPDAYGAEEPQDYDGSGMDGDAGRSARCSRQAYDAPDDGQYEDNDRYEDTYEAPKRRNQRQAGRSRSTERRGRGGGYTPKH